MHAARLVRTGVGGPDAAAVLVTTPPAAHRSRRWRPSRSPTQLLAARLGAARHAPRAPGSRTATSTDSRVLVDDDGTVAFDDFSVGRRDRRAVLAATATTPRCSRLTAQLVGNERAIAATVDALGKERAGAVIPVVQPAALPRRPDQGRQAPRQDAEGSCAPSSRPRPAPRTSRRSRSSGSAWSTSGCSSASCSRSAIAIPSLEGIDWASVQGEFENATWGWAFARARPVPAGPDGVGHRAPGLREQGPAVRPHRADPARVHLPEPDHAERHRRHRAAARLPAQAGRAGRVGGERDGAQHRCRRRDPDDPVPHRRGDHRDRGRHQQQQRLLRQHQPDRDRGRRRADRRRALRSRRSATRSCPR